MFIQKQQLHSFLLKLLNIKYNLCWWKLLPRPGIKFANVLEPTDKTLLDHEANSEANHLTVTLAGNLHNMTDHVQLEFVLPWLLAGVDYSRSCIDFAVKSKIQRRLWHMEDVCCRGTMCHAYTWARGICQGLHQTQILRSPLICDPQLQLASFFFRTKDYRKCLNVSEIERK